MSSYQECAAITELDLDPIKIKLMHKESGEGWTLEYANAVEAEYRRFLYLMKMFPHEAAAPLVDVDTFWHYHILDTMKYARDCEAVFGYFLHHYPYVGLLGDDDDLAVHAQMGRRMQDLYETTFGAPYGAAIAFCAAPAHRGDAATGGTGIETGSRTAFCAAPNTPAGGATAAFCAAPAKPAGANASLTGTRTAFCAAPAQPVPTRSTQAAFLLTHRAAFCAAPNERIGAKSSLDVLAPIAGTAFCAAPSQPSGLPAHVPAFCAAPSRRADASESPGGFSPDAKTAFCAAPSQPVTASTVREISRRLLERAVAVA